MLRTLDIENIAVIEKASVNFSDGLNVLTGEYGNRFTRWTSSLTW